MSLEDVCVFLSVEKQINENAMKMLREKNPQNGENSMTFLAFMNVTLVGFL